MPRQAAVQLTLSNGQFVTTMKQSGDVVQSVAQKSKRAMDTFGVSADNVRQKVASIGTAARTATRYAISLGGAFTAANALRGALELQTAYRHIAFGVKDANGQMLRSAEVQRIVERSAAATGQANAKMAKSFGDLLDATGDLEFSRKVLGAVGTTATATGKDIDAIGRAAEQLHEKFGVGADGMLDALAQVVGASKQGGPKFEELAALSSNVGAELLAAGLDGKRGLDFMLGALVTTKATMKDAGAQAEGLKALLRSLSQESSLKGIAEKVGIRTKDLLDEKDVVARIRAIFSQGKGAADKLMEALPAGEQRQVLKVLFTDPFEKALANAQKSGLKGRQAIDAALLTFDRGITEMGRASMSGAEMQRQADAERKTPEAQLTAALNTLSNAMSDPRIIKAIDQLAAALPKLAEHIAEFIAFAAEHPVLAGAGAVGGNFALDALGGAVGEMLGGGLASGGGALIKKMLGRKGAGAAAGGAAGALGGAASGLSRFDQHNLTPEMLGADEWADDLLPHEIRKAGIKPRLGGAGGFMPKGVVGSARAAGPWVAAIMAAGAVAGYGINRAYDNEGDVMGELQNATAAGFGGGSRAQKEAALARLKKARSAASKADIGGGVVDHWARLFTDIDTRKQAGDQMKLAGDAIAKLEADLAKPPGERAAGGGMASTGEVNIVGRVKVDAESSRLIATATTTALGGKVLDVRITNAREIGFPTSAGPGSSRGPMQAGAPRQGGGV